MMPINAAEWIELVHAPLLVVGSDCRVRAANAAAAVLLVSDPRGQALCELVGDFAADLLAAVLDQTLPADELVLDCVLPTGAAKLGFRFARPADASDVTVLTLARHAADPGPHPPVVDWSRLLQTVVERLPVGVEIYDSGFNELYANHLSDDLFLYDDTPLRPHHDAWWDRAFPDPEVRGRVIEEWQHLIHAARADQSSVLRTEWEVVCRDGASRIIQFRFRIVGDTYVVVFWDVTERRRLEQEFRRLAGTDALTDTYNRRRFFEAGGAEFKLANLSGHDLCLLMLDMDRFKRINDQFGHGAGDTVLKEVAARCRAVLRQNDIIARMGGEEFAILLPGADKDYGARVAQRLMAAIRSEPITSAALTFHVQASIGIAVREPDDPNLEAILERADRALYLAKARGRSRIVVGDSTLRT
ncbi:GGDEF domain-containing protein [Roseixanthobacter pseudopolyaromaticivorans]|uniref:GGDEF domain-containing protein n=1 Tax=Xanthobacteraceae TaxID=335928 RepID=UPI0037284B7D